MGVFSRRSEIGIKSAEQTLPVVGGDGAGAAAVLESAPVNKPAAVREMASLLTTHAHYGELRDAVHAENFRCCTCRRDALADCGTSHISNRPIWHDVSGTILSWPSGMEFLDRVCTMDMTC